MSADGDLNVAAGGRLDRFLADALPHASRRQLRQLAAEGRIRVNGKRADKGAYVRPGDVVSVPPELLSVRSLRPQAELETPILFQDEHLVALDKPAAMPSVAQSVLDTGTAANFLAARFPETLALERGHLEAGLVHRLDTATSGVLVGARNSAAYRALRESFRGEGATKAYRAVVEGDVTKPGVATAPIRTRPGDRKRVEVVAADTPGNRPATTRFRPLKRSASATLLEVEIDSGARHQIRAHLASLGHPIVGDDLYGAVREGRLLLHACSVTFDHPARRNSITIESPLPGDFEQPFSDGSD